MLSSLPWPCSLLTNPSGNDAEAPRPHRLDSAMIFWLTDVAETLPFVIAGNQQWQLLAQEVELEEDPPGPFVHP
jgi:hypothetical protein